MRIWDEFLFKKWINTALNDFQCPPWLVNKPVGSGWICAEENDYLVFSNGKVSFAMIPVPGSQYYIGETPVTRKLWYDIVEEEKKDILEKNADDRPMTGLSYGDCLSFIAKLNKETHRVFRLPTGSEWVYAFNGGDKHSRYTFAGSNDADECAWYLGNSENVTHPVKQKKPNVIGLYDMSGNVFEWTTTHERIIKNMSEIISQGVFSNRSSHYYARPDTEETDKLLIYGGSYLSREWDLKTCNPRAWWPTTRYHTVGMRLILDRSN